MENTLHKYIAGIIIGKGGSLVQIGGMPDHLHILLRIGPAHNLSDLVKDIKVNSSRWIKNRGGVFQNFSWQEGFGAYSVSKSNTDAVQKYILNQKEHHTIHTFENELINLLQKHDIEYDQKYVFA